MSTTLGAGGNARLEEVGTGRLFLIVAAPLLMVYLATATWSTPYNIDAFTNVLSSWQLGTHGSALLEDHEVLADEEFLGSVAWVVPAGDSVASQYPPGAALLAAPIFAVWPHPAETVDVGSTFRPDGPRAIVPVPPLGPAAVIASVTVAAAIGLLAIAFRMVGAAPGTAVVGAYLAGLGTSAWSVAADQLWQHGPAMMWIAVALVLAERRSWAAGLAWGAAVLTRPTTALMAAAQGLYWSWRDRSLGPVLRIGVGAAAGLVLFLAYNALVFDSLSPSAGYGSSFQNRTLSGDLIGYVKNVALGLTSPTRGLLVWSPFLVVLIPGLRAGWRAAPPWARGAAAGAVLYLLVQYKANQSSGGEGFFAYRYPLEPLVAAAPVLFLSFREWVAVRPAALKAFTVLAAVAVTVHAIGAVR